MEMLQRLVVTNNSLIDAESLIQPLTGLSRACRVAGVLARYLIRVHAWPAHATDEFFGIRRIAVASVTVIPAEYQLLGFYAQLGKSEYHAKIAVMALLATVRTQRRDNRVIDHKAKGLLGVLQARLFGLELSAHELAAIMGGIADFVRIYNPTPVARALLEALAL